MIETTWQFEAFALAINAAHDRLAEAWPLVRARAAQMPEADKVAWNAAVYVQRGLEVQLAHGLAEAGGGAKEERPEMALGVFAGLPGGGAAHDLGDPRFAVPRLRVGKVLGGVPVGGAAVGVEPFTIGAWIVFGIVALALLLAVLKVTGVLDAIERHMAYVDQLNVWRKAGGTGTPPPPPKPPLGEGVGSALLIAGAVAGGLWVASKLIGGGGGRSYGAVPIAPPPQVAMP